MTDEGPPPFDAGALIAELRRGDTDRLDEAYRRTFDNSLGRLVLGHFMAECGVGSTLGGPDISDAQLRYRIGLHDAAITLATNAHFDAAAIISAIGTHELEGFEDEPAFNYTPPASDDEDF